MSSCQSRDDLSLWDAHLRLASDEAVDLVIWLGDFIYDRNAANLQEFRASYAEARGDPRLQASAAAHPWLITWDDHEVVDNYDASVDPGLRSGRLPGLVGAHAHSSAASHRRRPHDLPSCRYRRHSPDSAPRLSPVPDRCDRPRTRPDRLVHRDGEPRRSAHGDRQPGRHDILWVPRTGTARTPSRRTRAIRRRCKLRWRPHRTPRS